MKQRHCQRRSAMKQATTTHVSTTAHWLVWAQPTTISSEWGALPDGHGHAHAWSVWPWQERHQIWGTPLIVIYRSISLFLQIWVKILETVMIYIRCFLKEARCFCIKTHAPKWTEGYSQHSTTICSQNSVHIHKKWIEWTHLAVALTWMVPMVSKLGSTFPTHPGSRFVAVAGPSASHCWNLHVIFRGRSRSGAELVCHVCWFHVAMPGLDAWWIMLNDLQMMVNDG